MLDAFIRLLRSRRAQILTLVLVGQATLFYTASHGEKIPLAQPLAAFPVHYNDWQLASEGVVEKETQDVLKADDLLTRWYVSPLHGGANLFIAYFKTQRTGQSPHSPKNCLPGSGWTPSSTGMIDVAIPSRHETITINRYVVSKGEAKSVVLYWYQTKQRVIADEFAAKFWLVADSVRLHRSDTALVRVVIPVKGDQEKEATDAGINFVQETYPLLRKYLPS